MKPRLSLTLRLTILFAAASSAVLLGLGFVIAAAVEMHFEQQDLALMTDRMELIRSALEDLRSPEALQHFAHLPQRKASGRYDPDVLIYADDGGMMFATTSARLPFDLVFRQATSSPGQPALWKVGGATYRGVAARFPTGLQPPPGGHSVVSAAVVLDVMPHMTFMRSFSRTLWSFVAGAAAFSGILGWLVARRGLAPLHTMRDQARTVSAQRLGVRLATTAAPKELAELAESLNDMLERLEQGFRRLSEFSTDIAHELRTPVSNMMTQTQVALSRQREGSEYRRTLESNAEEFERMARMISDMLLLAEAPNGPMLPRREVVSVASEFRDLFEYFDAVAEEKGLHLTLEGDGDVDADKLMLRRALANLISNAVRHAAAGTAVKAGIVAGPEAVSISIQNQGETIPAQYLERVFDRFFRVDPSRQRGGTGLGLAITKSIVVAHGGTIAVASSAGVTRFTITLPRTPGSERLVPKG